jgi:hypothetical protein
MEVKAHVHGEIVEPLDTPSDTLETSLYPLIVDIFPSTADL